jgi:hypothetical protein
MSPNIDTKVIGYFAKLSPTEVVCEGDACVIAGSEEEMKNYLKSISANALKQAVIRKTRFSEIMNGIKLGAPYAFDEQAYDRFYPLANKIGFNLKKEDFSIPTETGRHFVVVRP